jgi:AraC-like DNA-binding protein
VRAWTAARLRKEADRYVAGCFDLREVPRVSNLAAMLRMRSDKFSDLLLRWVGERPSDYLKQGRLEREASSRDD